ncbi:MAG: hypothetical protein KTR32_32155, partial [Granulosicoccus sp.]|nr:hypothetical protein [Granulosicoccus sp.]
RKEHPTLKVRLPDSIRALSHSELNSATLQSADVIVIGVSSPGVRWASDVLENHSARPATLALVTKGLVALENSINPPLTYADALDRSLTDPSGNLVGIGGPCIARELALRQPTHVVFASRDIRVARQLRSVMQTSYYRISTENEIVGVEACAALKNFLCIGVSAMITRYPMDQSNAKNPLAALFNQAVQELLILSRWISSASEGVSASTDTAFMLAGMADLHVTVGGGRNSRLGSYLGQGRQLKDLLNNELNGVTVEGVDTGRMLYAGFKHACQTKLLDPQSLPLSLAILNSIMHDTPFNFDFTHLPPGSDHET